MRGFSFRLTHKIVAIGIVGIAGVMLVGGIHVYGESSMAVYRDTAQNAQTISELSGKIEIELLEGRRAEKDFLLRNDSKKADSQINIAKAVAATCFTAKSLRPAGLILPVRSKLCAPR